MTGRDFNPQSCCGGHGGARCPGQGNSCHFDRVTQDLIRPNASCFGVRCRIRLFVSFRTDGCRSCGAGRGPGTSAVSWTDMAPGPWSSCTKGGDTKRPTNPTRPPCEFTLNVLVCSLHRVCLLPVFQNEHADSSRGLDERDVATHHRSSPPNASAGVPSDGAPGPRF